MEQLECKVIKSCKRKESRESLVKKKEGEGVNKKAVNGLFERGTGKFEMPWSGKIRKLTSIFFNVPDISPLLRSFLTRMFPFLKNKKGDLGLAPLFMS